MSSISPVDRRISSTAVEVLKGAVGENITRIAEQVADKVPGISVAQAVAIIDRDWAQITAEAGKGAFSFVAGSASDTRGKNLAGTVAGQQLPHPKRAEEVLASRHIKAAGSIAARQHTKGDDTFVVHGPQYWEVMSHTKPFEGSRWGRIFDHALTFLGLDGARQHLGYNLTRLHIDRVWSMGEKTKALRGISGTEIEALTKPGPNGEPAPMQPGDLLLCGGGGDGGLTHSILYAGPAPAGHPDAGAPMIVHAMATLKEGADRAEWIKDKIKMVRHNLRSDIGLEEERFDRKTGVLYERLGDFFNRYHRDSIAVVRDATLSPAQIAKGIAHAMTFTGYDAATGKIDTSKRVPYDYKLAPDDLSTLPQDGDAHGTREYLAKYCTEICLAFLYAAHDGKRAELPYVGTAHYSEGSPWGTMGVHETFISEPEDLAASPDLARVLVAGGGAHALEEIERLRLCAPIAKLPRDKRPIPEPISADV